jgi:hypothetical protein
MVRDDARPAVFDQMIGFRRWVRQTFGVPVRSAAELERITKKKRAIVSEEGAEGLTDDEQAAWERILGTAAGDPELFDRKRREAATKAKLHELKDQRKLASLPRQPLLAEPGAVQLPPSCLRGSSGTRPAPGRGPSWMLASSSRCWGRSRTMTRRCSSTDGSRVRAITARS